MSCDMLPWIIAICATFTIVIASIILIFIYLFKKTNAAIDLEKYKINIQQVTSANVSDIQKLLEDFITDCFDTYLVTHPEMSTPHYISEQEEVELRKALGDMCGLRISEPLYKKLSLYYNVYTLTSIIAEKIYIRVTAYVVNNNTGL